MVEIPVIDRLMYLRPRSSIGQSVGLRSQRLEVRILPGIILGKSFRVCRLTFAASLILRWLLGRMRVSFSRWSFRTPTCSLRYSMAFQIPIDAVCQIRHKCKPRVLSHSLETLMDRQPADRCFHWVTAQVHADSHPPQAPCCEPLRPDQPGESAVGERRKGLHLHWRCRPLTVSNRDSGHSVERRPVRMVAYLTSTRTLSSPIQLSPSALTLASSMPSLMPTAR